MCFFIAFNFFFSFFNCLFLVLILNENSSTTKWANILSADIKAVSLNCTDEKIKFHVLKQNLIEFRDLVLGEKKNHLKEHHKLQL